jgi:hypothetical protein
MSVNNSFLAYTMDKEGNYYPFIYCHLFTAACASQIVVNISFAVTGHIILLNIKYLKKKYLKKAWLDDEVNLAKINLANVYS